MNHTLRASTLSLTISILIFAMGCGDAAPLHTGGTGGTTASGGSGGAGGTTVVGGTGGVGGQPTGGGGAKDPCGDYMGQAPKEAIALSPFFDAEAEILALEATGELVAGEQVYTRIVADLAAIRATTPEVQTLHAAPSWAPSELFVNFDGSGYMEVEAGTYIGWSCANDWYGKKASDHTATLYKLVFEHRLNPEVLAVEYDTFPHTSMVAIVHSAGDGDDVCVSIEDPNLHHYVFDKGEGDCQPVCSKHTYWGFTTDGATLTPLGTFTSLDPEPAWFTALPACTKWL